MSLVLEHERPARKAERGQVLDELVCDLLELLDDVFALGEVSEGAEGGGDRRSVGMRGVARHRAGELTTRRRPTFCRFAFQARPCWSSTQERTSEDPSLQSREGARSHDG
jgi:hypothetical protein